MKIPQLTKDLAIIQKLSDLPNSTDGLTAGELKAKFDEAALAIQKWLNEELLPSLRAENIPYKGTSELSAETVQEAVEMVFEQVKDAAGGQIVNGSVTKEKVASALLKRIYGGRLWLSLNTPTNSDTPEQDFPIGQMWLRPAFTVENLAAGNWTLTNCGIAENDNRITVTGNNTTDIATVSQSFTGLGQAGDRAYVLFDITDKDLEIEKMTVSLNGQAQDILINGIYEAELTPGGGLQVQISAQWPSATLAGGSFTIENFTVVNADGILRQTEEAEDISDWGRYLKGLLPFEVFRSPRAVFVQTSSGIWEQMDFEVFPTERGGTGLRSVGAGELLFGTGDSEMKALSAPTKGTELLQFVDGAPQWRTTDEVAESGRICRWAEGSYVGTGEAGSIALPGAPVFMWLFAPSESMQNTVDVAHQFFQNSQKTGTYTGTYTDPNTEQAATKQYTAGVTLKGSALEFWETKPTFTPVYPGLEAPEVTDWQGGAVHLNAKGTEYRWLAIY